MRDDFVAHRWRTFAEYSSRRAVVFAVAYFGYAACYLVRNNIAVVSDIMVGELGWTTTQVGAVLAGFSVTYGIGKLAMGVVVDRYSLRRTFAWGLGGSSVICIAMAATDHPIVLMLGLAVIGILQGACAPAALAMLGAWYPAHQRGSRVAIWNTSQNVGGAFLPLLISGGLALTGPSNWQVGLWLPGIVALACAGLASRLGGDRPWQEGLPTLKELYPGSPIGGSLAPAGVSYWRLVRIHVFGNRALAALLVLNALFYLLRFGILNWIPIYLVNEQGLSQQSAAAVMSAFEWGAIPGALAFALIAHLWPTRTSSAAAIAMAAFSGVVLIYASAPHPVILTITVGTLGALVYGPQVIINILTLNFVSPRAIGIAVGWVGLGGYLVGALSANVAIPQIVDVAGWPLIFTGLSVVGAGIAVLCLALQRTENRAMQARP